MFDFTEANKILDKMVKSKLFTNQELEFVETELKLSKLREELFYEAVKIKCGIEDNKNKIFQLQYFKKGIDEV